MVDFFFFRLQKITIAVITAIISTRTAKTPTDTPIATPRRSVPDSDQ